ncbi:MAG: efflux RND transporter periplasmic adaptor subunit [Ignavibacteria bacterium]|jgi:RND family efflux transporter MFP subunit
MNTKISSVFLIASLLLIITACNDADTTQDSMRPVRTAKPIQYEKGKQDITLPASINELRETKLSFRVGGPLLQLNDIKGAYVKKGELIAKIDPRDFRLAVEATKSQFELATIEYERYKNLKETETVSKSVYDKVETGYKLAKTNYERAVNALADVDIVAPFSGYINNVFVNNYEMVKPGQPILSLIDMSMYEVNAWISVEDAINVNENSSFICIVSLGDKKIQLSGKLKEIGTKTSFSKQSLPITVVINAPDNIKLSAGMTTFLEITNNSKNANASFTVPSTAIFTEDNEPYVWVYDKNTSTVSACKVTTGSLASDNSIEIKSGITGNEDIVTAGVHYLFEGQKVKKMEQFSKSNIGNKL